MRTLAALAICAFVPVRSADADLEWTYEGYPRILKAAETAKAQKKRILVGMSGSPT